MEEKNLAGAIEAILFVYAEPIALETLAQALSVSFEDCCESVVELEQRYQETKAGLRIRHIEDCIQICTHEKYVSEIGQVMAPVQKKKLSKSVLETLAIIAYKQPVTRIEIEEVRGVRCEYALTQLLKQGIIEEAGHRDTLGKPTLFQTTQRFLTLFGIENLDQLPPLESNESIPDFEGV